MIANADFDTGTTTGMFDDDVRVGACERAKCGNGADRAGEHVESAKGANAGGGPDADDAGGADGDAGAGMGADGLLIVALAGGATVGEAARVAGVGERTVYRRRDEPGFRARVNAARAAMVADALGRMAGSMSAAADTLRGLLSAEKEAVRLGAARSILELGTRLREAAELERRITDLETTAARRIEQLEELARDGE